MNRLEEFSSVEVESLMVEVEKRKGGEEDEDKRETDFLFDLIRVYKLGALIRVVN